MPVSSSAVQETLQPACCYNQCPPLYELNDDQFLAVVYGYLVRLSGVNPVTESTAGDIQEGAKAVWCEMNMAPLCSIPPDKLKALILFILQLQIPFDEMESEVMEHIQEATCFNQCPPMWELEDNQYLALLLWFWIGYTGTDPMLEPPGLIQEAAFNAWCQFNMKTFPIAPPDKVKALSAFIVNDQT